MSSVIGEKQTFEDFLSVVVGGREVGLAIARDLDDLARFVGELDLAGFARSRSAADLFGIPKTYLVAGEHFHKDVYDFIVQYPTGRVQIFDGTTMRSRVDTPDYAHRAIVLVVEKDELSKFREMGFDLLAITGPAYQENSER